MKKIVFTILFAMFVMPARMAFASWVKPSDNGDTIPADIRCEKYYYTKWFDECSGYYPNGGVISDTQCRFFQKHNFYLNSSVAKWEHTSHRMKVKGLVAMVDKNTPPWAADSNLKLPEYLYLYQLAGRYNFPVTNPDLTEDGLDLVLLDSVRWDTATARVMELQRGWDGEFNQYIYLYEAYFEQPVYVDSDFYIYGSHNSNVRNPQGHWLYATTEYLDIMDFGGGAYKDDKDSIMYFEDRYCCDWCRGQGGYVGLQFPEWGWYSPWPDSPWGYYLPIVDQWNLNATPNDDSFGEVLGGGRFPDDSYDTIEAVPTPGYHFHAWSDGSTENPRVIHLTSDTSFVAIFYSNELFNLQVTSSDETLGTVTGSGTFLGETDNPIVAMPNYNSKFLYWNDGVTDNPRVVHLVSDTAFVAHFAEKEHYNVETASNNDEWGTVEGGGVYMEGEEATLTVATGQFCVFEGWSDGNWDLPRNVTVTQDTLFTALFSFDSAWAAGIDMAGSLEFSVLPNPTNGHLTIKAGQSETFDLTVFDMNGKRLLSGTGDDSVAEVDISAFPAGRYLLVVRGKDRYGIKTIIKK